WSPEYEPFLTACWLREVCRILGATPCKELVTTLIERWRSEMNTFHLIQGEATITLEDVDVLTRLPTRGLPVTVAPDRRSTSEICQQWLGVTPPARAISGSTVRFSWVRGLFDRLPVEAPLEVVTIYARAFTWVLVGAVLLVDRSGDHIPVYLLPLIGDPLIASSFRISFVHIRIPFVPLVIGGDIFISQNSHLINLLRRIDTTGRHV
ncbi:Protein MAIN-LIKE 2, partial [Linum perenne]